MSAHLLIRDATIDDAEGMARAKVEGWSLAYAGFIPDRLPVAWSVATVTEEWRSRLQEPVAGRVHLVAADSRAPDDVLGFASGGPPLRDEVIVEGDTKDYTAQVYAIYVAPARHGEGIGRRLLGQLTTRLAAEGHRNLCLWALELNPFRRFYDRLGGQTIARAEWTVGDTTVTEIAYGWPEIGDLIWACSQDGKTE